MPRNDSFVPSHEPLRTYESLHLQPDRTSGSFSFLNPTRARYHHKELDSQSSSPTKSPLLSEDIEVGKAIPKSPQHTSPVHYKWRARDNRKGRHALVIESTSNLDTASIEAPAPTHSFRAAGQGIWRMCTQFPYWNISYLVATIFTLGSVIWVMNAFFVYLPLAQPQTEFNTEILYGGGITAFIGATVFEIGSVLLMIEAVNENRAGCFGWALERLVEGEKGGKEKIKLRPDLGACAHHHTNKRNFVGKGDVKPSFPTSSTPLPSSSSTSSSSSRKQNSSPTSPSLRSWQWFPSPHALRTHYLREIGFLASFSQFLGATIFWISGFTALPGINNRLSQNLLDGVYWVPQIAGGTGFIVSGLLFMLETQRVWWLPAWRSLGWHIGLWNLIGALGFTLSGALGPAFGNSGAEYEAALATFWGSWSFLIGSVVQWYECLDQYPVEVVGKEAEG